MYSVPHSAITCWGKSAFVATQAAGACWQSRGAQPLRRRCAPPQVSAIIPAEHVAVQCTYFEKSVSTNWLVPVHQDLGIPVASRLHHPALSGWSEKEGTLFVQPPAQVLQELVAIRVHLDDCTEKDGPLRVVPGSHLLGKISADSAPSVRDSCGEVTCTLSRGAVLTMRPLLLHASSKAKGVSKRRVLHFLFGPRALPYGLQWPCPLATHATNKP